MKTVDELADLFRQQGLRVTPQRRAIFGLLHGEDRHPTVESIYDAARAQMPTISLKTVYQTVNAYTTVYDNAVVTETAAPAHYRRHLARHLHN